MEYFNDLLQPWRRVSRGEFVLALTVLSAPGMVMLLAGMMESGSSLIGPLLDAKAMVSQAQSGDMAALQQLTQQLTGSTSSGAATSGVTPAALPLNLGELVNSLCLLLLTPFVRGRLLDMGYTAKAAMVLALVVQLSVLAGAFAAVAQREILPFGWLFGLLTLVGYTWLTIRGGKPRKPVHERAFHGTKPTHDDYPTF